jgi:hypothetical protein
VPPALVTVTSTVPAVPEGAVAVSEVSDVTAYVAAAVPKRTPVTPVKPDPVMVTVVPPAREPALGLSPVTAGVAT